jgi:tripartite-type tricarboxylate transporter receptor subunit TctC
METLQGKIVMTKFSRRSIVTGILTSALLGAAPVVAQSSANYPAKAIKLVVPYPPGGAADLTARTIGQKLSEQVGQPVLVENKPGANGIIGTDVVAKSTPDGYTILIAPREVYGINPTLHAPLPYDPEKDLAAVSILTEGYYVLVANPNLGVKTLSEFLALAKSKPLSYGSFGIGSMGHLNLEAFARNTGIKLKHIPYKGAPNAVKAVVAGEVAVAITTPPAALSFLSGGKLVALACDAPKRLEQLPNVPTLAEAGVGANTLMPAYFAIAVPAKTPQPIIVKLNAEFRRALSSSDVIARLKKSGLTAVGSTADEMARTVEKDIANFSELINAIGIVVK